MSNLKVILYEIFPCIIMSCFLRQNILKSLSYLGSNAKKILPIIRNFHLSIRFFGKLQRKSESLFLVKVCHVYLEGIDVKTIFLLKS